MKNGNDLISRQAAIDAIDKNHILGQGLLNDILDHIADEISALPSAQPEIIRCKDCKHQVKEWRTDKRLKGNGYMVSGCDVVGDACGYWALLGQDDDFCSYAERKEQNVENS